MLCSLFMSHFFRSPLADARQIFEGKRSLRAFGFLNKSFGDKMIFVLLESLLSARELLQTAFGGLRTDALQCGSALGIPLSARFQALTGKGLTVRIGRNVRNAQIHAQNILKLFFGRLFDVARSKQKKLAVPVNQITFALLGFQEFGVMVVHDKRDSHPAFCCPDRDKAFFGVVAQDSTVIANSPILAKGTLFLFPQSVGISNFGNQPDNQLRGNGEGALHIVVHNLMQLKGREYLMLPRFLGNMVTNTVAEFQRFTQGIGLFRRTLQQYFGGYFYTAKIQNLQIIDKYLFTILGRQFLPQLKQWVSLPKFA